MISENSVNESLIYVTELDRAGRYLAPVPNSPLATLFTASRPQELNVKNIYEIGDTIRWAANSYSEPLECSHHDAAIGELREQLAPIVMQQIKYIRTVVNPNVRHFIEIMEEYMRNGPLNEINQYEIVQLMTPPPLYSGIMEYIEKYSGGNLNAVPYMNLPVIPVDTLIDQMTTMVASLDKSIAEWIIKQPRIRETIGRVWDVVFRGNPDGNKEAKDGVGYYFTRNYWRQDGDRGIECAIIAFLLARKLYDNPPDGITTMSLKEYNDAMSAVMLAAAQAITREYGNYLQLAKSKKVIEGVYGKMITVYAENYDDFLGAGGTSEMVISTAMDSKLSQRSDDMLENKEVLAKIWADFVYSKRAAYENNLYVHFMGGLDISFRKLCNEIYSKERDDTLTTAVESLRLFREELKSVTRKDIDDLAYLATRLITRSLYAKTDAYQFSMDMIDIAKIDDKIEPEEVAYLATHKYITRWVCSQIRSSDKINLVTV